jgi:hypothetical protein
MPALVAFGEGRRGHRGCGPGDLDHWYPVVKRTRFGQQSPFSSDRNVREMSKNLAERRQIYCWMCAVNAIPWRSRVASPSKRHAKYKRVANCCRNHAAAVTRMPGGSFAGPNGLASRARPIQIGRPATRRAGGRPNSRSAGAQKLPASSSSWFAGLRALITL